MNSERFGALFSEWHPDKNGDLELEMFSRGSEKKVWWVCERNHAWQASIANRVKGSGCPYCANRRVLPGYNDLRTTNPELAMEWHSEKNEDLDPRQVTQGARKLVWWRCSQGHEWQAVIADRNSGNGCPYCANKKVLANYNDLQSSDPEIAMQWHPSNNGDLRPSMVTRGSHRKVWWQCSGGHEWQAVIKSRVTGIGCPYCSNKKVLPGYNDLKTTIPAIAEQWHPTKNGKLQPDMVTDGSNRKVWWQCVKGHVWEATVASRKQGTGCPSCAKKRVETGENDICTGSLELRREWHPVKNLNLTPDKVAAGSHRKVWWMCGKGHEWQATPKNRMRSPGCPVCSNKRVEPGYNDLNTRCPELASQWNFEKNKGFSPNQVAWGSHKKVWWKCARGHEWYTAVADRVWGNNCPYCSNKRILTGENDLQTLRPELAEEWHPQKNGKFLPSRVSCGSNKKVWWKCARGHEWQASVTSRVQGNGCPECSRGCRISFPEKAVAYYLKSIFPDLLENVNRSVFPWLGRMEIDIYIPSLKLGIEYDGPQHVLESDQRKNNICSRNGVWLIRIRDDRLPEDPEGSVNIRHKNQNDRSLENAILEIHRYISRIYITSQKLDVNINRDRIHILRLLGCFDRGGESTSGMLVRDKIVNCG